MKGLWNSFLRTGFRLAEAAKRDPKKRGPKKQDPKKREHRKAALLAAGFAVVLACTAAGRYGPARSAEVVFAGTIADLSRAETELEQTKEETAETEAATEKKWEIGPGYETTKETNAAADGDGDGESGESPRELSGDAGGTGAAGENERTGAAGEIGENGRIGEPGAAGEVGRIGDAKAAGDAGETGATGEPVNAKAAGEAEAAQQAASAVPAIACSKEDYRILQRIVQAEAGDCDLMGRILVANVVINRVRSSQFPDTIAGVVYQRHQFSPVANGTINTCRVTAETVEAVDRALAGEDYSRGALFFMNRRTAARKNVRWFDSHLSYLFEHDGHEFFK